MAWFDKDHQVICPSCQRADGVGLVWEGGSSRKGLFERDYLCSCGCDFTHKYQVNSCSINAVGVKNEGE